MVDPVDGTYNFAHGVARFAVIVALCRGRETLAGWIHDPVRGETALAELGGGAELRGAPLRIAAPSELAALKGTLHAGFPRQPGAARAGRAGARPGAPDPQPALRRPGVRPPGHRRGRLQPVQQHQALGPSGRGAAAHREAGGQSRLLDDRAYRPQDGRSLGLLSAPDRESWLALRATLFGDALAALSAPAG